LIIAPSSVSKTVKAYLRVTDQDSRVKVLYCRRLWWINRGASR
jgi:hypothetical protein